MLRKPLVLALVASLVIGGVIQLTVGFAGFDRFQDLNSNQNGVRVLINRLDRKPGNAKTNNSEIGDIVVPKDVPAIQDDPITDSSATDSTTLQQSTATSDTMASDSSTSSTTRTTESSAITDSTATTGTTSTSDTSGSSATTDGTTSTGKTTTATSPGNSAWGHSHQKNNKGYQGGN